jgi:hypothetical protein
MPTDGALAGVPGSVGSGTVFPPALGADSACRAGAGPTGLGVFSEIGCGGSVWITGFGLPARFAKISLTACSMLLRASLAKLTSAACESDLLFDQHEGAPGEMCQNNRNRAPCTLLTILRAC